MKQFKKKYLQNTTSPSDQYYIRNVIPETLPKGRQPTSGVGHAIKVEAVSKSPNYPPYYLGSTEEDQLEYQIKDLLVFRIFERVRRKGK